MSNVPLLGPDGKEMGAAPGAPKVRAMPTRAEKFNMVLMMFTLMTKAERQTIIKQLRPLRRKLDLMYPNGMSEDDIKADMQKAAQAVVEEAENEEDPGVVTPEMLAEEEALNREITELSEQEIQSEPEVAEVGAEQSIPDEPTNESGC